MFKFLRTTLRLRHKKEDVAARPKVRPRNPVLYAPTMSGFNEWFEGLGLKHFKAYEITNYWSAVRHGIRNEAPPQEMWDNIVVPLKVLDTLRERLGVPIIISSNYRSRDYNAIVGGESKSRHLVFNALDFSVAGYTPDQVAEILRHWRDSGIFTGGIGVYHTFTHVDDRGYEADWDFT